MPASREAPPKECPKCHSMIFVEEDLYGTHGHCIMCGYVHEVLTGLPVDLDAEKVARQRRSRPSHGKLRL